jgi:hypothetical protein
MAITSLPAQMKVADPLVCAICGVRLALTDATAGLFDADNQQAFACVSHYSEVEKLIAGWAEFSAYQRRAHAEHNNDPDTLLYGGGGNAWTSM